MDSRQRELGNSVSYCLVDNALNLGEWDTVRRVIDKEKDEAIQIDLKKWVLRTICERNLAPPDDMSFLQEVINIPNNDEDGYTPLMYGVQKHRNELIIKLVENGANVATVVDPGVYSGRFNALLLALKSNFPVFTCEAYAALINEKTVNYTDSFGNAPLHLAAKNGNNEVMALLLKSGAELTMRNMDEATPLLVSLNNFSVNTLQTISQLISPSTVHMTSKYTPLHIAAQEGHTELIDMLKAAGADLTVKTEYWETPLQLAVQQHSVYNKPQTLYKLIPNNEELDFGVVIDYICQLVYRRDRGQICGLDFKTIAEVLSRFLLCIKRDFFHFSELRVYPKDKRIQYGIFLQEYERLISPFELFITSLLIRQGLGATTSLHCSAALSVYKAEGGRCGSSDEDNDFGFERATEQANTIDGLFVGPMSLYHLCAFTIRACVQGPKHKMIPQLPLPKVIISELMFQRLAGEICDLL